MWVIRNSYVPLDLHFTEKEKTITLEDSIREIKELNKNMGRVSTKNNPEIKQWITEEIIENYSASIPIDFNKYVPFELSASELEELNRNMKLIMELMPEENDPEVALIPIEIYSEPIIIDSELIHPVEFPFTKKEKPRTFEDNIREMEEIMIQMEALNFQHEEQNKEIELRISDKIRRQNSLELFGSQEKNSLKWDVTNKFNQPVIIKFPDIPPVSFPKANNLINPYIAPINLPTFDNHQGINKLDIPNVKPW